MKEVAEKTSSNFAEIVKKWLDRVEDADVRSELEDELRAEQLWS